MKKKSDAAIPFRQLRIRGFRRLKDVSFAMRPLTVMIGGNGSGKTTVLDVFTLLARSAQGQLSSAISDFSGLSSMITKNQSRELSIELSSDAGHLPLDYRLRLRPTPQAYSIEHESLTAGRRERAVPVSYLEAQGPDVTYYDPEHRKRIRPTWEHKPFETALSQVPKVFRQSEEFRASLSSCESYHTLDIAPRSPIRLPQPMRPAAGPGTNGEALVSFLYWLRETDRLRFEAIEDTLRAGFPRFERLDFPPVAAGTIALTWREGPFATPLYMHELSEGTLRFLWLATLLQSPRPAAVTLIDEPEVSLHPELLSLMADLLREASLRSQVLVATHSDRLIRFLKPEEILVFDLEEDGATSVRWADELDLEAWLKEYSLDELWSHGRLGARAW